MGKLRPELTTKREKKPIAVKEETLKEAQDIFEKFVHYSGGIRLVLLIYRAKEGAESSNNDKYRKYITNGPEQFKDAITLCLEVCKDKPEIPFRIYSSVNSRNINKAIRQFKQNQLDADYYDTESRDYFYLDIKNRFISALMTPSSRAEGMFLLDCDSNEAYATALTKLGQLEVDIVDCFPTKNGWHIVTAPFNPALLGTIPDCEIKKDGLLLLRY